MSTYKLSCEELKLSKFEAEIWKQLKEKGMSREEIEARAVMYEFMEDEDRPSMTNKMRFLFQLNALNNGWDHDDLVDLRSGRQQAGPGKVKRGGTKRPVPFFPKSA